MFRGKRDAPARVGCFGKLPTFGDFLSLRQESPDAQEYAEWVQSGMSLVRGPLPGPSDALICFVHHPQGSDRVLLGMITPSADSAGRVFPFTIFVSAPGSDLRKHGAYEAFAAEPVWRQLRELHRRMRSLPVLRDQYALLQEAKPVAIPTAQEAAAAFPAKLRSVSLERAVPGNLALQVRDVARVADELGRSPTMPDFGLRLRLHQPIDPSVELSVWARMLFAWADESDACSIYLRVSRSEKSLSAFLCRRAPRAEDLTYLLAPTPEYRFADDLGFRTTPDGVEDQQFAAAFQDRWIRSQRSCQDLLELGTRTFSAAELAAFSGDAAGHPAAAAAAADDADDDEITSEIDMSALRSAHLPPGGPLAEPPTSGHEQQPSVNEPPTSMPEAMTFIDEDSDATGALPSAPALVAAAAAAGAARDASATQDAAPDTQPASITAEVPNAAAAPSAALSALTTARAETERLTDSLVGLLGGAVLAGRVVWLPSAADGSAARVPERVFVAAGETTAHQMPAEAAAVAELERQTRGHALAKAQLEELEASHRALEAALARALAEGSERTRREHGWP